MRTAIGLIGLGLIAGVVPTGLQGITYALQVLAGTAGALTALAICCLASTDATRRQTLPVTLRWGFPLGLGRVVPRATSPSGAYSAPRPRNSYRRHESRNSTLELVAGTTSVAHGCWTRAPGTRSWGFQPR